MKMGKSVTALTISAGLFVGLAAQGQEETPVDMKDLPSQAQATIKEKAGNDQIVRVAKETRKGKECYDAVVNRDGKWRSGWTPMASLSALIPRKASKRKRPRNIDRRASG